MSQPLSSANMDPEKVVLSNVAIQTENQKLASDGQRPCPNTQIPGGVPRMNGPRGGIPFVVYDASEFQDRSESTWSHCPKCNNIGMSVLKSEFSWRAFFTCSLEGENSWEIVHYCPFCKAELGRRINVKGCCC